MTHPFAYYDPTTGKFAVSKDDLPHGAVVWPLDRRGDAPLGSIPAAYACSECGGTDRLCPHGRKDVRLFAEVPVECSDDVTGKWCWSTDEEAYRGKFETEGEAHGDAIDDLESDGEDGEERSYWIARCCHPMDCLDGREYRFGEMVAENIDEWMMDDIAAEDQILSMSHEDHEELGRLIFAFVRSRSKVQYYGIKDAVEHKHVVGSEDGGE